MRKIASAGYRPRFRQPWYRVIWPEGAGWPVLPGAERTGRELGGHASEQTSRRNGRTRNARRKTGSPPNMLHVASQFFLSVPRGATCHYTCGVILKIVPKPAVPPPSLENMAAVIAYTRGEYAGDAQTDHFRSE